MRGTERSLLCRRGTERSLTFRRGRKGAYITESLKEKDKLPGMEMKVPTCLTGKERQ